MTVVPGEVSPLWPEASYGWLSSHDGQCQHPFYKFNITLHSMKAVHSVCFFLFVCLVLFLGGGGGVGVFGLISKIQKW